MRKKKRFLALLLALVVALPFIQSPLTAQAADEGSVTKKITVVKGKDINDMQYGGKNVLHSSAWWYDEDGNKNPAFCVDPNLADPGEIAAGKYDVNVSGAETNEKIAAILNNSIPYKTYQELGVANNEEDELKSIFKTNKNPQRIIELLSMIAGENTSIRYTDYI